MDWHNLLKNGIDLGIINDTGVVDLGIINLKFSLKEETLSYVLGELVNQNDEAKMFDFFIAVCRWGSYEQMITVTDFVDCRSNNDVAFIEACMYYDEPRKIQFFIDHGVDVNMQDGKALGQTLHCGHLDSARVLLENGAILTDKTKLIIGNECRYPDIWELLYEFGLAPHDYLPINLLLSGEQLIMLRIMRKNNIDLNTVADEILLNTNEFDVLRIMRKNNVDINTLVDETEDH
jgi:hypothetical protein